LGKQQGVQLKVPPHPSGCAPHSPAHVLGTHAHVPATPDAAPRQVFPAAHLQSFVPPQTSGKLVPHLLPAQGSIGMQPHLLATPPPSHFWGNLQAPHDTFWPQLLVTIPQALPRHASLVGTQVHWLDVAPTQVSLDAHAVQRAASAQPLLRSAGTQRLPHFLVPSAQVPTTHALAVHTSVPSPGAGHEDASQLVAPQP